MNCGVNCSIAWNIVLSTRLQSDFWDMNEVLRGVWYTAWQAIGGGIGVLFLVVCWWTYCVACTTLGEVKLVAVMALPATLVAGVVVVIWLSTLVDRRSLTLCDGLSVIMAVRSVIVVACRLLSVAALGAFPSGLLSALAIFIRDRKSVV